MNNRKSSRRTFINNSLISSSVLYLGGLIPSSAVGANERINFGVIGVGGMGTSHLQSLVDRSNSDNIKVVAVSDVYQKRLTNAMKICNGQGYLDYRRLLDRNDIEAVLIATPDHWHAKIILDSLESGKHVYVEKPMTHTISEALKVRNAVKLSGKVLQVGPQRTALQQYWLARDIIKSGRLGKVTWAQGGWTHNFQEGINEWYLIDETAGPHKSGNEYVDWDMWLGHKWNLAPKIPWNPDHFFRFRKYFRYNGGVATDLLYHYLAPLLIAIVGENGEYPLRVNACGGLYLDKDGRDVPDLFIMNIDYPSEFTVNLISTYTNFTPIPPRIFCSCGTIKFEDELVNKTTKTTMSGNGDFVREFRKRNNGYDQMTLHTSKQRDMEGNFIDSIRLGTKLYCNVELGCATTVATCMAVESYRQSKTMLWDSENEMMIAG